MSSQTVFVAGSRQISRLPAEVKKRLDTMIEKGLQIFVGDANGADKAVQRCLAEKNYRQVLVHCMAGHCRNNVGGWPTQEVTAPRGARGFAYYSLKDQVMVDTADYGFMLWDGESKGTLNSVINMVQQKKPVIVYFAPAKSFHSLRSAQDLNDLLSRCDRASVERFERELGIEHALHRASLP